MRAGRTSRVDAEDLELFVVCAVRYAVGRRSCVPSFLTEAIRKLELSQDTREVLIRAIDGEERRGDLGDECDAQTWRSLREWLRGKGPSAGREP